MYEGLYNTDSINSYYQGDHIMSWGLSGHKYGNTVIQYLAQSNRILTTKNIEQAGAELCQTQGKLELTLIIF